MLLTLLETNSATNAAPSTESIAVSSLEALTLAGTLAGESDEAVHAVAFGTKGDLAAELSKYGVSTLHLLESEWLADYTPECWGASLAQLVEHSGAHGVVAAATDRNNEILAHAAARTGQAFASNCIAVEAGLPWTVTRQRGGGMLLEDAELSGETTFVSLAPGYTGSVEVSQATATHDVTVQEFTPELADQLRHSTLVDHTSKGSGVSLATARVIVSGGRGVGSAEGFTTLEELAGLLGGAVGCSRVATNNGWRDHSDQVGQTGTKIAADLYIACGISGATQHWVGCMGAKTILAINTDPEAPLVNRAHYAVIGDVGDVLPAIVEKVRAYQSAAQPALA